MSWSAAVRPPGCTRTPTTRRPPTAGSLAVAVIPVSAELDPKALAVVLGVKQVTMADPAEAERATGFVFGGMSPLGQKRRLPIVVDRALGNGRRCWSTAAGAASRLQLAPADPVALTGALVAPGARGRKR